MGNNFEVNCALWDDSWSNHDGFIVYYWEERHWDILSIRKSCFFWSFCEQMWELLCILFHWVYDLKIMELLEWGRASHVARGHSCKLIYFAIVLGTSPKTQPQAVSSQVWKGCSGHARWGCLCGFILAELTENQMTWKYQCFLYYIIRVSSYIH